MEATAAGRGGPISIPTQQSRKEWRAVSDHHSVRNVGDEDLERSKLGQADERTIYEVQQGREPLDVDFCSLTMDESLDNDILQRRLHDVARQREELQEVETELRAQIIARSEIMELQNSFDAQLKEQANAAAELKEQLHQRDQTVHELERKLEEKDRELHAIKLDNEAAWAKEDLLIEQNKELATFRRERDHSEAERAQHIKKIHELQEHIQEKERQLMELQEQHRVVQETIIYKDDRLREAQAWISRVQEIDALQSTTLQAELRERTEQYNQLWIGCQRQFAEMERVHLYTVQKLQLELADARESNGTYTEESRLSQENSKDVSQYGQNDGNQLEVNGNGTSSGTTATLSNGNSDNIASFGSSGNPSSQIDHSASGAIPPSSIPGMPSYLPPAQLTALHPFVMHQQVPQTHVGHFQPVPQMSSLQQWQNQQAGLEDVQTSTQTEIVSSHTGQNLMRSDYHYDISVNGQAGHPEYLNAHIGQGSDPNSGISSSAGEAQVLESIERGYLVSSPTEQELKKISSQFHDVLGLALPQQNKEPEVKEQTVAATRDIGLSDHHVFTTEHLSSAANSQDDTTTTHQVNFDKATVGDATDSVSSEAFVASSKTYSPNMGRTSEIVLLDERSLLACIVRTIPPGGRIRISSTLPNRLGKMLAPLHWHDYKKKYGKLDDFLSGHPELFVIEGDHIQLREGAQKMVAANAAVAKVAAAAAAPSSYSSSLPTVAVTPIAQNRLKKNQQPNGVYYGVPEGLTNVKSTTKLMDSREPSGPEARPGQVPMIFAHGRGSNLDRSSVSGIQSSGSINGRSSSNIGAKQQARTTGVAFTSRR